MSESKSQKYKKRPNNRQRPFSVVLKVHKLNPSVKLPSRQTEGSAGLDICSSVDGIIQPRSRCLISTGLSFVIPKGFYGRLASRSGLAVKHGLEIGAGVIDSDYRGEVKFLVHNHSDKPFHFSKDFRMCQLILERIALPKVSSSSKPGRGSAGFGSTGWFFEKERNKRVV
ncbi:hypothetical protein BSKO_09506 [Bryopsis sp. KO-2023]|nr:hypothetical protein BSKO_09506 [Bryopsis sp. KO-2023]